MVRLHLDPACCFPVGASGVFTPAPDAITTVPMNVPVRHDYDKASGLNNYDHIAISVLAPGVPIPAFYTGDQSLNAPVGGGFYPAYVPGTERTTGMFGVVGFQTLINADLDPSKPDVDTPTGPTDLVWLGKQARVRNGRALVPLVPLVCRSARECAGLLRLQRLAAGAGVRQRAALSEAVDQQAHHPAPLSARRRGRSASPPGGGGAAARGRPARDRRRLRSRSRSPC